MCKFSVPLFRTVGLRVCFSQLPRRRSLFPSTLSRIEYVISSSPLPSQFFSSFRSLHIVLHNSSDQYPFFPTPVHLLRPSFVLFELTLLVFGDNLRITSAIFFTPCFTYLMTDGDTPTMTVYSGRGPRSLDQERQTTIQSIIDRIKPNILQAQNTISDEIRLHFIIESSSKVVSPSNHSKTATETIIVHSPTINLGIRSREASDKLLHALQMFTHFHDNRPYSRAYPHADIDARDLELSRAPSHSRTNFRNTARDYALSCNSITRERVFPWFPARVRPEADKHLNIPRDIVSKFSTFPRANLIRMYQDFFSRLYLLMKTSDYADILCQEGWSGKFSYESFAAPWLCNQLCTAGDVIFLNKTDVVQLPSPKALRNNLGTVRASRILAAFYINEAPCAAILDDLCAVHAETNNGTHQQVCTHPEDTAPRPLPQTNPGSQHQHSPAQDQGVEHPVDDDDPPSNVPNITGLPTVHPPLNSGDSIPNVCTSPPVNIGSTASPPTESNNATQEQHPPPLQHTAPRALHDDPPLTVPGSDSSSQIAARANIDAHALNNNPNPNLTDLPTVDSPLHADNSDPDLLNIPSADDSSTVLAPTTVPPLSAALPSSSNAPSFDGSSTALAPITVPPLPAALPSSSNRPPLLDSAVDGAQLLENLNAPGRLSSGPATQAPRPMANQESSSLSSRRLHSSNSIPVSKRPISKRTVNKVTVGRQKSSTSVQLSGSKSSIYEETLPEVRNDNSELRLQITSSSGLFEYNDDVNINCANKQFCPYRYNFGQTRMWLRHVCLRCNRMAHDSCAPGPSDTERICHRCRKQYNLELHPPSSSVTPSIADSRTPTEKTTGRPRAYDDDVHINCASGKYCPLRFPVSQDLSLITGTCTKCKKKVHDNCGGGETSEKICALCRIAHSIPFEKMDGTMWKLV